MIKFYMTPGSCSTGIHFLLEHLELVFQVYLVNLMEGDQNKPDYLALNPKGTIPTLVTKESLVLTDFLSIAWWLGKTHPKSGLLPQDLDSELKVLSALNYTVNTIHGQGFTRIFTGDKYSSNADELEKIEQQGKKIVSQGFEIIGQQLHENGYLLEQLSIADAALFYVEFWADKIELALPEPCQRHYSKMLENTALRRVLSEEGYRL